MRGWRLFREKREADSLVPAIDLMANADGSVKLIGTGNFNILVQMGDQFSKSDEASPTTSVCPPTPLSVNQHGPVQQVIQIVLNDVPIRGMLVMRVGGKFSGFGMCVQGDLFPALTKSRVR